jgi:hypothetical protein
MVLPSQYFFKETAMPGNAEVNNLEVVLDAVRVFDYWQDKGAPYADTMERIGYGQENRTFLDAAHRLGGLLVDQEEETGFQRRTVIPPLPNFRQLGFETAGHALWYAVDQHVRQLTSGEAFFGEVTTPEAFQGTEIPCPILAAFVGNVARRDPVDYPAFALAISKIESPQADIPVLEKYRIA